MAKAAKGCVRDLNWFLHLQILFFFSPNHKTPETLELLSNHTVDHLELPEAFTWTVDDVSFWIKSLSFPQYENTFRVNFIDGRRLLLVDAAALVKMNVRDFDHIKMITKSVRGLFEVNVEMFDRSISLLPGHPEILFKFHKVPTGESRNQCTQSTCFNQLNHTKEATVALNHFEKLHEWFKHIPNSQNIRVGGINRVNLYFVEPNPHREMEKFEENCCGCEIPPCECNWSDKQKRKPWRLTFLVEVEEGKYDE